MRCNLKIRNCNNFFCVRIILLIDIYREFYFDVFKFVCYFFKFVFVLFVKFWKKKYIFFLLVNVYEKVILKLFIE